MYNSSNDSKLLNEKNFITHIKPREGDCAVKNIVSLSTLTDSVVATVEVRTETTMGRIVVDWDDGSKDVLRVMPGVLISPSLGQNESLTPGVYQFNHAYENSEDGRPFDKQVQIAVYDRNGLTDSRVEEITLTPRYKVIYYPMIISDLYQCEPILSNDPAGEFRITRAIEGEEEKIWYWNPKFFEIGNPSLQLDGSGWVKEMLMEDRAIIIRYDIIEIDNWFDDELGFHLFAHPRFGSQSIVFTETGDGCKLRFQYDREIKLLIPLPPNGGGPLFKAA